MPREIERLMREIPDPAERLARAEFRARRATVRARKAERRKPLPVTVTRTVPRREKVRRIQAEILGYVAEARQVGEPLQAPLPPGSVVLLDGLTGTAYQLFHSDGLYHAASGVTARDHDFMVERHAVILYVAPDFRSS